MPYVGNKPEVGNFRKCDAITTSATATYNLLVGGVAVNPNQNQVITSLNGVIQSSGDSYTIANSQITFASALTSSDVIDFILILGDTLDVGVPSDDTVDASKITANIITGQSALGATPADTDELLVSDAGVLKRVDYSYLKNANFFIARNSGVQAISDATWTKVTMGTEDVDADGVWDTTNSKFTAPTTGNYIFSYVVGLYGDSGAVGNQWATRFYKNGSLLNRGTYSGLYLPSGTNMAERYQGTTCMLSLSASDYIELYAYFNVTSGSPAIDQTTQMSGFKIIT